MAIDDLGGVHDYGLLAAGAGEFDDTDQVRIDLGPYVASASRPSVTAVNLATCGQDL